MMNANGHSRPCDPRRPPTTITFESEAPTDDATWRARAVIFLKTLWRRAWLFAAAIWVFGGLLLFFIRFSTAFYLDNERGIRDLLAWLGG